MLKIGRYEAKDLDIEDYHGCKDSISRTKIMTYDKCPRKYEAQYLTGELVKEVTKPMILGSAFHTYILEPDLFPVRYGVLSADIDRRTTRGKFEVQQIELSGRTPLDYEMMETLINMKHALASHAEAAALVWGGNPVYERSYIYGDDGSGLVIKSRPDILRDNCIVDLKSCQRADQFSFSRSMVENGNHIQGAMAQDAIHIVDGREDALSLPVVNIAIETTAPHCIAIYFISQDAIEAGRSRYRSVLMRMKASFASGYYRSYETKEIGLPAWYSFLDDEL